MATLTVLYPAQDGAKFDRDYYSTTHMALVADAWGNYGYQSGEVLYPAGEGQPYAAITMLRFKDQASIDAAMGAPRTGEVQADVANFTTIVPALYRAAD